MLACRGRPSSACAHLGSPWIAPPRLPEPCPPGSRLPPHCCFSVENSSSSFKGPSQMPFLGAVSLLPASSEYWSLLNIPCHRRHRCHHGLPPATHLPGTGWRGAAGGVKGEGSVSCRFSCRGSSAGGVKRPTKVGVGGRVSDTLSLVPSPSLYRGEAEALGGRHTPRWCAEELAEPLDTGSRLRVRRGPRVCSCCLSQMGTREPALLPGGLGERCRPPPPAAQSQPAADRGVACGRGCPVGSLVPGRGAVGMGTGWPGVWVHWGQLGQHGPQFQLQPGGCWDGQAFCSETSVGS